MSALLLLIALAAAHEGAHESIARLEAIVAEAPDDVAHRVTLADQYRRAGSPLRGLIEAETALSQAPSAAAWLVVAECHRDLGDLDDAFAAATRALPESDAWALRAEIQAERGLVAEALADWSAAIVLRPTADRVLARGRLAESAGLLDVAAAGYAEGLAALDHSVPLRLALFDVERRRGRPAAARAQADALLALVPDHPEWLLLRASVQADPAAASADLERALAVLDAQIATRPTEQRAELRHRVVAALETR